MVDASSTGCKIMQRIAYCLLVHKNPKQVSRLLHRIYSPSDYFYVHAFTTQDSPPRGSWPQVVAEFGSNVTLRSKYGSSRGSFSLVEATLEAMDYLSHYQYDYFVNLSGQCYPLRSTEDIRRKLGSTNAAYLEYFKLDRWDGGPERVRYIWLRIGDRFVHIPRLSRTLPYELEPYGGSQWMCLPKIFVDYVLDSVRTRPRIARFYRYSRIPEEMFFQTIIMNSDLGKDVVNDNLRYICWGREGDAHPAILRRGDIESIIASGKLFARKFDTSVDESVLDMIDRKIERVQQGSERSSALEDRYRAVS